jgi:hypothetical protein
MNPLPKTLYPDPPKKFGPGEVLDDRKRAEVLHLISLGCSRRMAARRVRCSHTTIARTAGRDPIFALDLSIAESELDMEALALVRAAASDRKYWRAAAWILERRNPEEYGKQTACGFSGKEVMAMLAQVFAYTSERLPEAEQEGFLRMFNGILRNIETESEHGNRWRRLAASDSARTNGELADLASPYEHPNWRDPAALDPLEKRYPEDYEPHDPSPIARRVEPSELMPQPTEPKDPAPAAAAPVETVAPSESAKTPSTGQAVHQSCPDCQPAAEAEPPRKVVEANGFHPRPKRAPVVHKPRGGARVTDVRQVDPREVAAVLASLCPAEPEPVGAAEAEQGKLG